RHLVCEVFLNDPDAESMIINGMGSNEIRRRQVVNGNFRDLWDDGLRLVRSGITTLDSLEARLNPIHIARAYRKKQAGDSKPSWSLVNGSRLTPDADRDMFETERA